MYNQEEKQFQHLISTNTVSRGEKNWFWAGATTQQEVPGIAFSALCTTRNDHGAHSQEQPLITECGPKTNNQTNKSNIQTSGNSWRI